MGGSQGSPLLCKEGRGEVESLPAYTIFSRTGEVVNKDVGINKDFSAIWKVYWHGGVYESYSRRSPQPAGRHRDRL